MTKSDEFCLLILGFIILIIAIAGNGCQPVTENNYYDFDVEVVMPDEDNGDGGAEESADDDDSGEEEPEIPSDDDDSAKDDEEPQEAALEIMFLSYGNDGPFTVFPGDEDVVLGRYLFTASGAVTVRRLFAPIIFNPNPEELYSVYNTNETEIEEHVDSCVLADANTGNTMMGPVIEDVNGVFVLENEFVMEDEQLVLEFRCDFSNVEPEATYDGFFHSFFAFEYVTDANGEEVYPAIAGFNGTAWAPVLHAVLTATPVEYPSIEFALSAVSPSGAAVPWWETSVMIFNVTAYGGDVTIEALSLDLLSTDNVYSQWNQCTGIGTGGVYLYDLVGGGGVPLGEWQFATANGPCPSGGRVTEANVFNIGFTVLEGTTAIFQIAVDAQNASASTDDVLQVSIGGATASAGGPVLFSGLPVSGGIIQF